MNYMDVEQMIEDRRRGNFGYWLKWIKAWDRRQAAFLLLGKCPLDYRDDPTPDTVENLLRIMEADPALPERISPLVAVTWYRQTFGEEEELPPELIALLDDDPPLSDRPVVAVRREAVKAGVAWRRSNPGGSRRDLKTALSQQLEIEIKEGWIDEIMRQTKDVPTHKGGRRQHP